jgi:hypothetical protein
MSSFTTPLSLEFGDDGSWTVNQKFIYHIGGSESGMAVEVPIGFVTDFASIPRIFWRVLPPTGTYGKAAVVHDFLYASQAGTREWADAVFLEAMGVLKVPAWKKHVMHKAVRLFGWIAWNKHAQNKAPA